MPAIDELRWRAMGTDCHVLAYAERGVDAVESVRAIVADLEARWSRFRDDSDISRVNRGAGHPIEVAADTYLAVHEAVAAREATAGRFDPTILRALQAVGYDRDFDAVSRRAQRGVVVVGAPVRAGADVVLDPEEMTITVEAGASLDLGGIGKGLAADLAATTVLARTGVHGVCVNLGGDLRAVGTAPTVAGWGVAIDDPRDGSTLATLALASGGLATSSTRRRRWVAGGRTQHHIIDPHRGAPAGDDLWSATVVAGTGARAEVLATAALVAGPGEAEQLLSSADVAALLVGPAGAVTVGPMEAYLR